MKYIKKIMDGLIVIALIILILIIYGYVEKYVFKKEYINYFGYTIFEVASGSMAPTINVGDIVLVKLTKDINQNDIITYKENNYFITHRVIKKDNDKIIAKGDYNDSVDKDVNLNDVLGKVIKIIPGIGIWKKVFFNTKVMISIVSTIILFAIYFYLLERKKEVNEEVKD
ncbi:signal peptidase I [bacterium]|nr:signal peptidase I [bacterium]